VKRVRWIATIWTTNGSMEWRSDVAPGQKRSAGRGKGKNDKKGTDKNQGQRRTLFRRRKVCKFCADKIDDINYKDVKLISPFVPERGKILPRRISGTCAMHQRKLQTAIKRARQIALVPYVTD
jgi:small subunit ribosomal protein S18